MDEANPDWVPTLELGHTIYSVAEETGNHSQGEVRLKRKRQMSAVSKIEHQRYIPVKIHERGEMSSWLAQGYYAVSSEPDRPGYEPGPPAVVSL